MDNLVFEESINAEIEQSEFVQKKWVYVNDTNSQNYSTQVVIDSTPLANAGGYINWGEAYLVMPMVIGLTSTAGNLPTGISDASIQTLIESVAFKNGFWNLINSFNIEYNNQTCVQQTAFTNVFRSFKAHTSFSQDDLKTEGPTIGYYPDTPTSWGYSSTFGVVNQGASGLVNEGFVQRAEWISYAGLDNKDEMMSVAESGSVLRSCFIKPTVAGKAGWKVYCKLRLKDLADFFGKTPLLKGSTIRLLINTNQMSSLVFTSDGTNTTYTSQVAQGYTNPLLVDTVKLQSALTLGNTETATFSLSIVNDVQSGIRSDLQSCRLYAPVYKMNPIAEQRYLSLAPTKRVAYTDIFQYQFSGVSDQFNILVTNGIPNIKSVLVVPFLQPQSTGMTLSPHLSPFDTAGATPDPVIITNFNILVSGVNLFLQNQLYDYEQFNHELKSSNQLNGSLTTGLASGLISEQDFSSLYRYYYGNCARVLPSEEGVSRSVQIVGQVKCSKPVNLMVFVEFEKVMTIDISTGARIEG